MAKVTLGGTINIQGTKKISRTNLAHLREPAFMTGTTAAALHMRLDYFMRGLKKLCGTPQKKKGAARAMMLATRSLLDLTDPDNCII